MPGQSDSSARPAFFVTILSQTQYTTKLKAWGYFKNNKRSLYPCIKNSLKRKEIDLDEVESVMISTGSGEVLIPTKKLKKALGRSNGSRGQIGTPGKHQNLKG